MALLSFWQSSPDAVLSLSIKQIVSMAGDGRLLDNSACSKELRTFLSQVPTKQLAAYAEFCLTSNFEKSGETLQDVVNELGRRLDYEVINGLYQGTSIAVGNDGLWRSPEGQHLLVEVKTTDNFRVSLDKIAGYRSSLQERNEIAGSNSVLLVVGRRDTGELEAQVRGSRHAWDMRLISVDALIKLVNLKESSEDEITATKIRSLLIPMEYTRLDQLVDVMFTAAKDIETAADVVMPEDEAVIPNEGRVLDQSGEKKYEFEFTEAQLLESKRQRILSTLEKLKSLKVVKKSPAQYWTADRSFRVVCTISKRYKNRQFPYWYSYHEKWDEFLDKGSEGYFVLGCIDLSRAFAIPILEMHRICPDLRRTTTKPNDPYWHIDIAESEGVVYSLVTSHRGNTLDLTPYQVLLHEDLNGDRLQE